MAQYEQKTDSREFEIANPDQNSGPWGGASATDATDIAIRLWSRERSARGAPLTWNTESVLVYMIADLVNASRGRVGEESPAVMSAHFEGSRQALVAAKRIQTSMLEFVACRPGERVGAAILIYPPKAGSLGFSGEMALQALGQAKPGQILLAENISELLRDLPGVEIRAVPALTVVPGEWQSGLMELIWTTPDRIALLQDSVGDQVEPQSADSPPVDATVIVTSPVRNVRQGPTGEVVPPVIRTSDFVFKEGAQPADQRPGQVPSFARDRAPTSELHESPGSSLTEELDESRERPLITRTRVILGAVAVVLVVVMIVALQRPARVSRPPLPLQPEQIDATGNSSTPPPATPQPEAKTAKPEPAIVKPQAKLPAVAAAPRTPAKPLPDNRVKNKKDIPEEPEQYIDDSGGVSQKDIPALLGMAQRDAGAGNYDKAKREYKKILSLQPGNQDARDGLRRLDLIQQDRQQDQQQDQK